MGQCIKCGRKGLFLFVNADGLCPRCAAPISDVSLSPDEIRKLDQQARARSAEFAKVHKDATSKFSSAAALRKIKPGQPGPLSLEEILFLWYLDGTEASGQEIAGYWTHDYNIDYAAASKKLFSYGYLAFAGTDIKLAKQNVSDLKSFLAGHALPVSGRKAALIQRILENSTEEDIDAAFHEEYFALTPAGKSLVNDNSHLIYFHQHRAHFGLSLELADSIKRAHPDYSEYDIALFALEKDGMHHHRNKDWGLWRNTLYNRAVVYQERGEYARELELLLQVCYIDIRGYGNGDTLYPHIAMFAPAITGRIAHICDNEQIDKEKLNSLFHSTVDKLDIAQKIYIDESFDSLWVELHEKTENV